MESRQLHPLHLKKKFFYFFLISFTLIILYIAFLQLYKGKFYREKSEKNFTRYETITPYRGAILDSEGNPFAITQPTFSIKWKCKPKKIHEQDIELIHFIKKHFDINIHSLLESSPEGEAFVTLLDKTSFKEISILKENFPDHPRITIEKKTMRIYPQKQHACHIVGYLNAHSTNGVGGFERLLNNELIGVNGQVKKTVNARGTTLDSTSLEKCIHGNHITTTINPTIQSILEQIIPDSSHGSAIVLDPQTGDIKGMVSSPRFDPSIFQSAISTDTWKDFQSNKTLLNRCTLGTYPPASPFKILAATAMLEECIVNEETTWNCTGSIKFKGNTFHCHNKYGHGKVNLHEAIVRSCNIPFYQTAIKHLSINTIYNYAKLFGLGEHTQSILHENFGLVPSTQWKLKKQNSPWYKGETVSVIIGQGATLVTPLQVARAFAALSTGYLIKPRLLQNEEIKKEKLMITDTTRNFLLDAMHQSTKRGSARLLKNIKNWHIKAKTGTAQVKRINRNKEENENKKEEVQSKHHAWITCSAKYKENCEDSIVLVILIEHAGSSKAAVKIAKDFFEMYSP